VKGVAVAVKVVHLSDLTDRRGEESEFGSLVVQHPDFREPIRLSVLPAEVEGLFKSAAQVVQLDYTAPGARSSQRLFVLLDDFNAAAGDRDMKAILMEAIASAHAERGRAAADGRPPSRDGGTRRTRVNYATRDHAGEAHRGRITEAEKAFVRDHLEAVNARLAREGKRIIDPADPKMQERYGIG
jgi:hypothetical protein